MYPEGKVQKNYS